MNDDASKPADNPWVVYAGTNQDPALVCPWNLPSPNIPWISGRITEQNVLLKRGCWLFVKACKTLGYWRKIYSSEKREWCWGCVGWRGWWGRPLGVRRGQGGGFCGPGIKAYPQMINNNTQCKTHIVQHHRNSYTKLIQPRYYVFGINWETIQVRSFLDQKAKSLSWKDLHLIHIWDSTRPGELWESALQSARPHD